MRMHLNVHVPALMCVYACACAYARRPCVPVLASLNLLCRVRDGAYPAVLPDAWLGDGHVDPILQEPGLLL